MIVNRRSGFEVRNVEALLYWVGVAAVAVMAITGVLDAARKDMDLVGAITIGTTTALGGRHRARCPA